jgi:hypothetical protein
VKSSGTPAKLNICFCIKKEFWYFTRLTLKLFRKKFYQKIYVSLIKLSWGKKGCVEICAILWLAKQLQSVKKELMKLPITIYADESVNNAISAAHINMRMYPAAKNNGRNKMMLFYK